MAGAELTFEAEDPDLDTGDDGSGLAESRIRAWWGRVSGYDNRYFEARAAGDDVTGDAIAVDDGFVTIATDLDDDEAGDDRRHVVTVEVPDTSSPPNASYVSYVYTRDSEAPTLTLSRSQSDISHFSPVPVTVSVGGTISDDNVIEKAELSLRRIVADQACSAGKEVSEGRTGRVGRNKRDLENDTNEIEFDESFTIRPGALGPETYCFWLETADVAVNSEGRGDGNAREHEVGRFTVDWPLDNEDWSNLMKLYDAMGGERWWNSEYWGTSAPLADWHGIAVDSTTGHVTEIRLSRNNLSGEIPPEIREFPHLQVLRLDYNGLVGEIPPEIGQLTELRRMDIDGNRFTGGIPPEIGNLEKLKVLWMGGNRMGGPIPPELANLAGIEELHLYKALFHGSIPEEFGSLTDLRVLDLRDNRFSGPLPPELGDASALVALRLQGNAGLTGPLPEPLTSLPELRELIANGTNLCMPSTPVFQAWLAESLYKHRVDRCDGELHFWARLMQAIQSPEYPVPLVAGESALLRVLVTAAAETTENIPPVRATFFVDSVEIHTVNIPAGSSAIPTSIADVYGDLDLSANAVIPAEVIRPGLEMVVEVDPDGTLGTRLSSPARIPREGSRAIDVREVPPFRLTLVPFVWTGDYRMDAVEFVADAEPDDDMFWQTNYLLPVASFEIEKHESVRVDSNNLYDLLADIERTRVMEAGIGNWMGLITTTAFANGIGTIPGTESRGKESVSKLDPETIAHEFGHNFSLRHAGCGYPADVDVSFPNPGGYVGDWGYDPRDGGRLVPRDRWDLMTYCDPTWVSDYHFSNALRFRLQDSLEIGAERLPPRQALLVSGGVSADGRLHLDPAFVIDAPPAVPRFAGPYALAGRRADGTELFSLSFEMVERVDAGGGAGFTFALPVRAEWASDLASLSLSGPTGSVEMAEGSEPPLAIVRDPGTGRVRAVFRDLPTGSLARSAADARAPGPGLEILVSSGLPGAAAWRR